MLRDARELTSIHRAIRSGAATAFAVILYGANVGAPLAGAALMGWTTPTPVQIEYTEKLRRLYHAMLEEAA
jgi:hypothetical protein